MCDVYVCVHAHAHGSMHVWKTKNNRIRFSAFTLFGIMSLIHSRLAGLYACSKLLSLLPSILVTSLLL